MGLMDKQTQQAFALGGLNDEGGEIDEASGNRVPIGGTKEGVRDDIEINISEGEFVFPADVVRYHGLDKMMALRQEAKMGLKQMERMGQMGNSEEATMPDDLPFGMADLIVVGGEGEPMEFAEGGFVPQMQTLETAPVPTMGGGTSTGTQTPIVYDDFMKTPVVTMQEYRDANGNSIIITFVNGKATTEIPAGYTLYTPPTNAAPTATQAAIQTANNYSYQTSGGGDEGPDTPRELQIDPDYASMDNDTYFSTMERQNSFGGKAGNAAAMGIAMAMGPFGLLTMGMLQADKRRQLAAAEQRIAAETNPTKKKAYQATFAKMGGKTKEPEEENALVKFGKGFVAAVGGLFGLGNNDVEKVASVAGGAAADNTNVPAVEQAPTAAVDAGRVPAFKRGAEAFAKGQPVTSEVVGAGPTALPMNTFADAPFGIKPDIRLGQLAGFAPASDRTRDILDRQLETGQLVERLMPPAPVTEAKRAIPTGTSDVVAQPLSTTKDKVAPKIPPSSFQIIPPTQSLYGGVKEPKAVVENISESASSPAPVPKDDTFPVTSQVASPSPESIQTNTQPVAQAAGTPTAGYDRQPVNRAEFKRDAKGTVDFFGSTEQFQARELLAEAARNERNMPGNTKNLETALINRYGVGQLQNAGLLNEGQIYARPSLLKDGSFRPDKIEGSEILADGVTPMREAPKSQVFFDGSMYPKEISPLMTLPQPSPAIERPVTQTDAALRPQTNAGALDDMIAGAPVRNNVFETGQPAVRTAGLVGDTIDAINKFGAEKLGGVDPSQSKDSVVKQLQDNVYTATPSITQAPAVIRQEPPTVLPDPAIQQTTVPRNLNQLESFPPQLVPTGEPYNPTDSLGADPMPDPRDNVSNISTGTGSQLQLGYGNFNSAEARQAALDQTANVFGQIGSDGPTSVGNYATAVKKANPYLGDPGMMDPQNVEDYNTLALGQTTTTTPETKAILDDQTRRQQSQKNIKTKAKPSTAASTSTGTRKAAPTGDDRRSDPNFLERAFGIEPAKISARRGNDGVLYRTQADKREADKRQEDAKTIQRNSDRYKAVNTGYTDKSGKKHEAGQDARDAFNKDNAADISTRHGGDKEDSGGKIVCSAMNNAYGFGSFRNKIWLEHSKNNLTKEHQVGYHRMFLPLIHLGYNKDYKFIRKCLEHIARHRTADIYFQSKSNKRDTLGMVYRTILEPICYLVGMFPTSKDNK